MDTPIFASQAMQRLEAESCSPWTEPGVGRFAGSQGTDNVSGQGFGDVTILASELCQTPMALVRFINQDQQCLGAGTGVEGLDWGSLPIGQSICAFTLGQAQPLVIGDLRLDPRTRHNPLVTHQPRLCFYAGVPLVTPDGLAVGTICVLDTTPRPQGLTTGQAAGMEALARLVMGMLEVKLTIASSGKRRIW